MSLYEPVAPRAVIPAEEITMAGFNSSLKLDGIREQKRQGDRLPGETARLRSAGAQ